MNNESFHKNIITRDKFKGGENGKNLLRKKYKLRFIEG